MMIAVFRTLHESKTNIRHETHGFGLGRLARRSAWKHNSPVQLRGPHGCFVQVNPKCLQVQVHVQYEICTAEPPHATSISVQWYEYIIA